MRVIVARLWFLVVAAGTTCAVATCHREVPPIQPIETQPAGPQPTRVPAVQPHWPDAVPAAWIVPASIAPEKPAPSDGGVDGAPLLQPLTDGRLPIVHDGATPM